MGFPTLLIIMGFPCAENLIVFIFCGSRGVPSSITKFTTPSIGGVYGCIEKLTTWLLGGVYCGIVYTDGTFQKESALYF